MQAALKKLEEHAKHLIQHEPERHHLSLMRNKAGELDVDLDVKDNDLQSFLDRAERGLNPARVYKGGETLDATESIFLLDGLIKLGEANVIIGQPKVGKSSFSTGFIAALRDKREQFLGRDILLPSQRLPVLIFGTDQSEGDWLHFLRREALVDEEQTLDPNVIDFFCSLEASEEYNFTKDGLNRMRKVIDQHQCPLVIIDSLSSMMEPTGIEENVSRFAQPIRNAIRELTKTGATLIIIHHSVKRPNTWDWIQECRGSSSISSVFSWGVLMRWVASEDDGLARTDRRVGFTGKGRGSAEAGGVMAEYLAEGGWTAHGSLEEAQKVERVGQRVMELGGVRAQVFDYLAMRTELEADVSVEELATELNKQKSAVARELRNLKGKGLAHGCRKDGQRVFWQITPAAEAWMSPESLRGSQDVYPVSLVPASKKNKKNILIHSQEMTAEESSTPRKTSPSLPPRTPVERFLDNAWQPGWLIHDASNTDAITIEKLGSPNIRIRNLRFDLDVRLPQPSVAVTSDPFDLTELPF